MDNPTSEPSLNTDTAAQAFGAILSAEEPPKQEQQPQGSSTDPEIPLELLAQEQIQDQGLKMVEVEIDGYKVSLPEDKAAKLQAERLMQKDYTQKTMAAAEERKAADMEKQRALQERQQYVHNLTRMQTQLESALQSQQQINWEQLIAENPQDRKSVV